MVWLRNTYDQRGEREDNAFARRADIESAAQRFIESGGRFECEVLRSAEVSLTAIMNFCGGSYDVVRLICPNGPEVPSTVDQLVRIARALV
jgi:hypothetical protein